MVYKQKFKEYNLVNQSHIYWINDKMINNGLVYENNIWVMVP